MKAHFEKETGIKVRYDTYDNNEILHAKLLAGKTGYDIVVPSSNWAKLQIEGGLYQKLDKAKLSNWKNLDPAILKQMQAFDPGNAYLVDWLWSYTTVGINVDKVKQALGETPMPDNAWDLVFNPIYTNKLKSCGITLLDTSSEVFPIALHYLGRDPYSKNPADYQAAFAMLKKVRPDIKRFNSGGQIEDLASGQVCVALGWAGDFNLARKRAKENNLAQNIVALLPKTGGLMFMDTMAIPADAPHPNNAHLFINYIRDELLIVLGTSSSESALPKLMLKLEKMGCARSVVGLVVPTGYSFNLDGTNIYMTMAALFIAQATNTELTLTQELTIVGVAMLTSKGASGITGAGFITLASTLAVVPSIPIAGMALILGIDRFMSEARALTNIIGNAVATVVISRSENELDMAKMHQALNGDLPDDPLPVAPHAAAAD